MGEIVIIARSKVKVGWLPDFVSKQRLVEAIEECLKKNKELLVYTLGLDEDHMPNKEWLINYLYSLNSKHSFFSKSNA